MNMQPHIYYNEYNAVAGIAATFRQLGGYGRQAGRVRESQIREVALILSAFIMTLLTLFAHLAYIMTCQS
jgi:hypothetical protein